MSLPPIDYWWDMKEGDKQSCDEDVLGVCVKGTEPKKKKKGPVVPEMESNAQTLDVNIQTEATRM